jgi:hypothetical protein
LWWDLHVDRHRFDADPGFIPDPDLDWRQNEKIGSGSGSAKHDPQHFFFISLQPEGPTHF